MKLNTAESPLPATTKAKVIEAGAGAKRKRFCSSATQFREGKGWTPVSKTFSIFLLKP